MSSYAHPDTATDIRNAAAIVVMGVAGSGKSTVAALLAQRLGWTFSEGDAFHPAANIAKMAAGVPLDEDDRRPWLAALRARIESALAKGEDLVVACSALKQSHRDALRVHATQVRFVYLKGDPELIRQRLRARQGHYMKDVLLASQLEALEEAPDALVLDVASSPERLVDAICAALDL